MKRNEKTVCSVNMEIRHLGDAIFLTPLANANVV